MESLCPPEPETEISKEGTRLHAAMESGLSVDDLISKKMIKEDEAWMIRYCQSESARLMASIFVGNDYKDFKESSLSYKGRDGFNHPDRYIYELGIALIIDYKFGYEGSTSADLNKQGLSYAVAVSAKHFASKVYVAFLQPRVSTENVAPVLYRKDDLVNGERLIDSILENCAKVDAPVIPGIQQCKYCKAKAVCERAYKESVERVASLAINSLPLIAPDRMVELYKAVKLSEKVAEAIEAFIKQKLEANPKAFPGLSLEENGSTKEITDPQGLYDALLKRFGGCDVREYQGCCKVKITDLFENLWKKLSGLKGKKAKESFNEFLETSGCATSKPKKPSIKIL